MRTVQQILSAKGFDNSEIEDILYHTQALDMKVRQEFGLQDEPLHLWESYYRGDANEEVLQRIADERGHDGIDGLLLAMDLRLNELCDEVDEMQGMTLERLGRKLGLDQLEVSEDYKLDEETDTYQKAINYVTKSGEVEYSGYVMNSSGVITQS